MKITLEEALAQVKRQEESSICDSNIGKRVRIYPGPDTNYLCFRPQIDKDHQDGTITSVYWQHGDIPLYIVKFDEGFEGAFFYRKKTLKFLGGEKSGS